MVVMVSSNPVVQASLPVFDGSNFGCWSTRMKVFFLYQEILDVVTKGLPPPTEQPTGSQQQAIQEAKRKDRQALYFIHQAINDVVFKKVDEEKTAKEAWDILESTYKSEEGQDGNLQNEEVQIHIPSLDAPYALFPDPEMEILMADDGRRRSEYLNLCIPLYKASMNGYWKAAEAVIKQWPDIVSVPITNKGETALHIAAAMKHTHFVKNLIERMNASDLEKENEHGNTAMCFAAASGVLQIAKMMVRKNERLPLIRGNGEVTPLYMAALFGHKDMVVYLYKKTDFRFLNPKEHADLFLVIVSADIHDIAMKMLVKNPLLATSRGEDGETALHLMARKPSAIARESQLGWPKRLINSCFPRMFHEALMRTLAHQLVEKLWKIILEYPDYEISNFIREPSRLLFDAAALGNVDFLVILLRSYPNFIWKVDSNNRSLFHVAAIHRQESIFNIVYELGAIKDMIVVYKEKDTGNNMLHLVATLPPRDRLQVVSGAALQMQRELLWFEAVKKIIPISYIEMKNEEGELPQELFTKHHKKLQKEGEQWMKGTATSCMLVATLIATVMFTAAFKVPDGTVNKTSKPILQNGLWFSIFVLSDAVGLFTSTYSIAIFLSILTSRYAEADFRMLLPRRLMLGLSALFISIVTMLLAFSASLFLFYNKKFPWIPFLVIALGSVTVLSYVWLHGPLWFATISSTFRSQFLFRASKDRLYG